MPDPYDLARFVQAQDHTGTYERALEELRDGRKLSHWMWFVFPQLEGLGHSVMARRYAIGSLGEARAYLEHPVLGPRLLAASRTLLAHRGRSAEDVLGSVDAVKLRSSMTLFARSARDERVFVDVLEAFFDRREDSRTKDLLDNA
jgi:uncharacterized protein (DUF1810 family)